MIRCWLISAFLIVFGFLPLSRAQSMDPGLVQFLSSTALIDNEDYIRKNIHQFYDRRMRRQLIHWYEGAIATSKGEVFQVPNIKFNVITHSIYLKYSAAVYVVPPSAVQRFVLTSEGEEILFEKGFSEPFRLRVKFTIPKNTDLASVIEFDSVDFAEVLDYSSIPRKGMQQVEIKMESANPGASLLLGNLLKKTGLVSDLKIEANQARISGGLFFQVLVDTDQLKLVKLLMKQKSFSDAISPVAQSYSATYDKQAYYLANASYRLKEIQLNKRSVRNGLERLGIKANTSLGKVGNEKDLRKTIMAIDSFYHPK